ncbi:MAG: ABC transporter permease [Thermoprotei archaeon]
MPNKLVAIIIKELKDLLRDRTTLFTMIIIPLIFFPVIGFAFKTGAETTAQQTLNVAILNLDNGYNNTNMGNNLISFIKQFNNINLIIVNDTSKNITQLSRELYEKQGINELLVIPSNFTKTIYNPNATAQLELYSYISATGGIAIRTLDPVLQSYIRNTINWKIRQIAPNVNPSTIINPVNINYISIVREEKIPSPPEIVHSLLASQSWTLPLSIFIIIVTSSQIVASAIASEKESKTLEILLSTPISRISILAGKITSSMTIAILSVLSYIGGFTIYMNTILGLSSAQISPQIINKVSQLVNSPQIIGGVAILMFITLLTAISIAVSFSVYAEDVRSAQALVSYVTLLFGLPAFIVMGVNIDQLPPVEKTILYIIPFTHAFTGITKLIDGNYIPVIIGITYMTIFSLAMLYIASKSFTTEKLLTAKLTLKRKKYQ